MGLLDKVAELLRNLLCRDLERHLPRKALLVEDRFSLLMEKHFHRVEEGAALFEVSRFEHDRLVNEQLGRAAPPHVRDPGMERAKVRLVLERTDDGVVVPSELLSPRGAQPMEADGNPRLRGPEFLSHHMELEILGVEAELFRLNSPRRA